MALKLSNNADGLLALAISDSDTSLTLEAGHGSRFPALGSGDWFPITVVRASDPSQLEIMRCTARTLDTLTVERAQEGTSAITFDAGDVVSLRLTSGTLEENFPQVEGRNAKNLRFSVDPDTQGKPELTVHGENGESTAFALKGELGARDLNAVFEDGIFVQPSDAGALAALNYPAEKAGVLTVKAVAAGVCTQQYFALDGTLYARTATGGSWSQWNQLLPLSALNLGKPTADPAEAITGPLLSGAMLAAGAIVEQGENANGRYWRWESGLQVCIRATYSLVGNTADNPLQITFPAVFIAAPALGTSMLRTIFDQAHAENKIMNGPPGTAGFLQAHTASADVGIFASYIAIGRWK